MDLTDIRHAERVALCQTFTEVGPEAPTLCSKWTAADLAAHVVVSERYAGVPMAIAYPLRRVVPARTRERAMASLQVVGERQIQGLKPKGWDWLLKRLAAGPPALHRRSSIAPIRLVEEWVHHEDVRRANAMPMRHPDRELSEALWEAGLFLTTLSEFAHGREGLEVRLPDGRSARVGTETRVRVDGEPGELLMFVAGRTSVARVDVMGDEAAIETLTENLAV